MMLLVQTDKSESRKLSDVCTREVSSADNTSQPKVNWIRSYVIQQISIDLVVLKKA
jgi:hypothetical protein